MILREMLPRARYRIVGLLRRALALGGPCAHLEIEKMKAKDIHTMYVYRESVANLYFIQACSL